MTPETREWVEKAEGDHAVAGREFRVKKSPSFDAVCFHAQQCAEKFLKARLCEASAEFPKTHDLARLLTVLLPIEPAWELLRPAAETLTDYAVRFRYPGATADRRLAREALEYCTMIRERVRVSLGLAMTPTRRRTHRAASGANQRRPRPTRR